MFDNVTALIFTVAMSAYSQQMREDATVVSRLQQLSWLVRSRLNVSRGDARPLEGRLYVVRSGKSGPKDQVALHYYYTSSSHWCTTHEVSKL